MRKKREWDDVKLLETIKTAQSGFYYNPLADKNKQLHRIARRLKKANRITMEETYKNQTKLTAI